MSDMHFGATKEIFKKAEMLRNNTTKAENLLWNRLRKVKYKFRRQHPIGIYIADFYCHEKKIIIEIDGPNHLLKTVKEYDVERTKTFEEFGLREIRFENEEILNDVDLVVKEIIQKL